MSNEIKMIPIDRIRILNPRHRDLKKFDVIVQSIKNLGLKKPIQVSLRSAQEAAELEYDLVCGQGRIQAYIALGHKEIPAVVVDVSKEDRLLRSLVENMARRHHAPLALIREIERLKAAGYGNVEIGRKLDIDKAMVAGCIALKNAGEERLLDAATSGLQRTLTGIQAQQFSPDYAASQQDFVMHTCLLMDLKQDADLLNFAKIVAANMTYSEGLRGNALLLIAKLGGKTEFAVLYPYLENDHDSIKIKAMEAIAALQVKVTGGSKTP